MTTPTRLRFQHRRGFSLVELMVVISIILLVSIATLPVVLPTIRERNISESALLMQAEISRARDQAIRTGTPQGLRLLPADPDTTYAFRNSDGSFGATPTYSKLIAIETGPTYSDGSFTYAMALNPANPLLDMATQTSTGDVRYKASYGYYASTPLQSVAGSYAANDAAGILRRTWQVVFETKFTELVAGYPMPTTPTSWFWNLRRGDRIKLDGGREMVVVGPMFIPKGPKNPEGYINWGTVSDYVSKPSAYNTSGTPQEFLIVLNGLDDDGDGFVDEAYDGIDNDGDGITDPGFNGLDDNGNGLYDEPAEMLIGINATTGLGGEWEPEADLLPRPATLPTMGPVVIANRPYYVSLGAVPAKGAREIRLPGGMMVDMTTWSTTAERSRLPVDPQTGYIDIMVAPNGQLVQPVGGKMVPYPPSSPFVHFWMTDSDGINEPRAMPPTLSDLPYLLPMPEGTPGYPMSTDTTPRYLKGNRRMVSVNTKTGQITTTTPQDFDISSIGTNPAALDRPYLDAQSGIQGVEK